MSQLMCSTCVYITNRYSFNIATDIEIWGVFEYNSCVIAIKTKEESDVFKGVQNSILLLKSDISFSPSTCATRQSDDGAS